MRKKNEQDVMGKKTRQDTISTFIGPEAEIQGTLSFKGTIRVDGKMKGKIESADGTLIVGESARIEADISVDSGVIMGEIIGTVNAKSRIEIYKPARITGDIQAPVISIDAGVTFNGNCSMGPRTISTEETADESIRVVSPVSKEK
jgi:cytoskeletal protein CcmA (bactofilin family)